MDKFDRIQKLHRLLIAHKRPVPLGKMERDLECSGKTIKRAIETLQIHLLVPLEYDKQAKGWYYDLKQNEKFELPGLWLTTSELQSLIALLHILQSMDGGFIGGELNIIEIRIANLLAQRGVALDMFSERIKFLPMAKRPAKSNTFALLCEALLHRKQLSITYIDSRNKKSERIISPQTLVYYRENWYLDSWCHSRKELRTFSVPRVTQVLVTKLKAKNIPPDQLIEHFTGSYGIFAGKPRHTATLKFHPDIAHQIADQQWHPQQQGWWDSGSYLLCFPYGDDRELVLDILKYGENVEVIAPLKLKQTVIGHLRRALAVYDGPD